MLEFMDHHAKDPAIPTCIFFRYLWRWLDVILGLFGAPANLRGAYTFVFLVDCIYTHLNTDYLQ